MRKYSIICRTLLLRSVLTNNNLRTWRISRVAACEFSHSYRTTHAVVIVHCVPVGVPGPFWGWWIWSCERSKHHERSDGLDAHTSVVKTIFKYLEPSDIWTTIADLCSPLLWSRVTAATTVVAQWLRVTHPHCRSSLTGVDRFSPQVYG
jgi:hypothetical protein